MVSQNALACFSGRKVVKAAVPTRRQGFLSLDVAVQCLAPPYIDIEIHPGQCPSDDVAEAGEWLLTCDQGTSVVSVRARVDSLIDERRVRLRVTEAAAHEGSRSFHRVDAEVYMKYWPAEGEGIGGKAVRQRVNLSGCGLRWLAHHSFGLKERLSLELVLPGVSLEVIRCTGRVVRVTGKGEQGFETALEIAEIAPEDMDRLLAFCMTEQFRQMQSKVRVLASFLTPTLATD